MKRSARRSPNAGRRWSSSLRRSGSEAGRDGNGRAVLMRAAVVLGSARTSGSSRCSSSSTPSSARWSAWSARSFRRSPRTEFQLAAKTAVLSFIVVFGVTKALTNYLAGRLSDRFGRKHVLVAGWLVAVPVPFLLDVGADRGPGCWWRTRCSA